jgi:peptide/nickel transport system permease protein
MIETLDEDFVRTARAKGLSERRVIIRHALRVSITPVITLLGIDLGYLLGGAIIVENVFNLQGVGQFSIQALFTNDFPAVMGVTVLAALFIIVANLVVDVVYAFLDPRVRYT